MCFSSSKFPCRCQNQFPFELEQKRQTWPSNQGCIPNIVSDDESKYPRWWSATFHLAYFHEIGIRPQGKSRGGIRKFVVCLDRNSSKRIGSFCPALGQGWLWGRLFHSILDAEQLRTHAISQWLDTLVSSASCIFFSRCSLCCSSDKLSRRILGNWVWVFDKKMRVHKRQQYTR